VSTELETELNSFSNDFKAIEGEVKRVVVGLSDTIRLTLASIVSGGNILLEGAPGLGKTLLVRSIAKTLGLSFNRIQFTSDLMPSDITGTQVMVEGEGGRKEIRFQQGPIFANIVLADEVNRAGPKTQSALLEAMEEKQVSNFGTTRKLPEPFFVMATQNPIELEGTYPLPEAQLDRFQLKLIVPEPSPTELKEVLTRTTGSQQPSVSQLLPESETVERMLKMRQLSRKVVVAPPLMDILISLVTALSPVNPKAPNIVREYLRFGPGPRGAQAVLLSAKVFALMDGRINLAYEDILKTIYPALRHRVILNYAAEAEGVTADFIVESVIKSL
jgi:MoxR-like ATPase